MSVDNYFTLNVSADISDVYTKRTNSNLNKRTFSLIVDNIGDYRMPAVKIEIHSIIVWKNKLTCKRMSVQRF